MTASRIAVVGVGATGARAARQLGSADDVDSVVLAGPGSRPKSLARALGSDAVVAGDDASDVFAHDISTVIIAGPVGTHLDVARSAVARGINVVSTSDGTDDVSGLVALDAQATRAGVTVVAGAAFSPGLSCVLAAHSSCWVDTVDEIHVARFGTGGPACARQHHSALSSFTHDWRDGEMVRRGGGSGRELCAFPDPVGSVDCYRAEAAETALLRAAVPDATRITARQAANRRQRFTSWLPMLRKPHPEGRIGAIRVELRGRRDGVVVTEITGVIDRPAVAAGAVAGLAARWADAGRLPSGAAGLASLIGPAVSERATIEFLETLSHVGVRAARFVGSR